MKKHILGLLAATFISATASANGYWEDRQVCDYETVQTQHPITACNYSGNLYAHVEGYYTGQYFTDFSTSAGHVNCPSSKFTSRFSSFYHWQSQQNVSAWFHGSLPLTGQNHSYSTSTETRVVEGSCRIERVWIELCDNCQIP